jgi:phospholipid/cholesterol/gamma-HCH transport system substrate-binding protein
MAADNRSELNLIARNLLEVSQTLKAAILTTSSSVEQEMAAVRVATEALNRTMGNVEEISAKINRGDGTIGQLVNDKTPMEQVTATLGQVNEVVEQVNELVTDANRIQTDVYYRGSYYFGTNPNEGSFDQNPVAGSMRNVVGVKIQPREDYWYDASFTTHPLGTFTYTDHYFDGLDSSYREYTRRPDYRFSFQFAKRFDNLVLRFGVKESSGGIGADYLMLHDKLAVSADLYDFTYASWPVLDQSPNLAMNLRAWPWHFLYLEAGVDNVIFGARHGFFTGYAGGGFTFNDQDLKLILPSLPIKP